MVLHTVKIFDLMGILPSVYFLWKTSPGGVFLTDLVSGPVVQLGFLRRPAQKSLVVEKLTSKLLFQLS